MYKIEPLKRAWTKKFAQKYCGLNDPSSCDKSPCHCQLAAELTAYLRTVIPHDTLSLTIHDLNGRGQDGEILVDAKIILKAKQQLLEYCWKPSVTLDSIVANMDIDLDNLSIMDQRYVEGRNIAVYASNMDIERRRFSQHGKTLIASIVMKEAIKRRVHNERIENFNHSYAWVNYQNLKQLLISDDNAGQYCRMCDWLVVDDIIPEENVVVDTKGGKFIKSHTDPFFLDRHRNNKPTILTFKVNIDDTQWKLSMNDAFGIGISKILNDRKTVKICLSQARI